MEQTDPLLFGSFRLDFRQRKLWRGEQEVILRPRSFAVLQYLAEHPGQLVSKEELRRTAWARDTRQRYGAAGVRARNS